MRPRCDRVGVAEALEEGRRALRRLEADARWLAAGRVGLFAATRGEPATRPIVEAAIRSGRETLLPRCKDAGHLEFAPVHAWDELEAGRYGLLEPISESSRAPGRDGDLVLVPGLAFDRRGGRLGRGGGYYDRCFEGLQRGSPWLLGLGFSFQLVDEVPLEVHDRRLDGWLTGGELEWLDGPGDAI